MLADDSSPYEGLLLTSGFIVGGIDAIQHWLSRPSTVEDVDAGGWNRGSLGKPRAEISEK